MAEAPAPPKGGSPVAMITRKVGPLPLWAYAAILVVGYFLYRRLHGGGSTSSAPTDTTQTAGNTYVPGFDAAGAGGGGGIGNTSVPSTVNNYYYGDQGTGQASGGGTSSGDPGSAGAGTGTGTGTGSAPPGGHREIDPGSGPGGGQAFQPFGSAPPPFVPRGGKSVAF